MRIQCTGRLRTWLPTRKTEPVAERDRVRLIGKRGGSEERDVCGGDMPGAVRVWGIDWGSLRKAARWAAVLSAGCMGWGMGKAQTGGEPIDATALVRRAIQHRMDEQKNHQPMRYVLRKKDERRETAKWIVETKDGDVARLFEVDGKPLSADAERAEIERLDSLAAHPEMQEHRRKTEQRDEERINHVMRMLPDAELYQMEGVVACDSGQCYRLSYKPNLKFTPPDLESDVLRCVAGEVWIDQAQERLVRLDAHFIEDVDFGYGILGKLNKGGTATLRQTRVDEHDWELTGMKVDLTGKALMVKSFKVAIDEATSEYKTVAAGMGYREGIEMLKRETVEAK
jgi:hypothetical protein